MKRANIPRCEVTTDDAREILQAYAEWAQALHAWVRTGARNAYATALEAEKDRTFEVMYGFYSVGKIREFYPDDRGIVWNKEDEEEYGMLSNIALSLEAKPKASRAGSGVASDIWDKATLKEFGRVALINNLARGKC